jgi:hypothetical protein
VPIVLKSGSLSVLESSGSVQACNRIVLLYLLRTCKYEIGIVPRDSRVKLITLIKIKELLYMSKDLGIRGKIVGIWNICHRAFSKPGITELRWRIYCVPKLISPKLTILRVPPCLWDEFSSSRKQEKFRNCRYFALKVFIH